MSKLPIVLLLALSGAPLLFSGCAGTDQQQTQAAAAGQEPVSNIPWNRPEKWEGPGVLGGQMNPQAN